MFESLRLRHYHIQREHQLLYLMKEHRHGVLGGFGFVCFASVSILRMARTLPDRLWLSSPVVPARGHAVGGWVAASATPRLTFGLATGCFTGEDVG